MYYANKKLLTLKVLSHRSKLTLHESLIRSIVTFGNETRTLARKDEEELLRFERKIDTQEDFWSSAKTKWINFEL